MKKILKYLIALICCLAPINIYNTYALESTSQTTTEYLGDGIYLETTIEETNLSTYATNVKKGTKTAKYKSANDTVLYTLSVTGTFNYTGSSSICTAASAGATSPASTWEVISKTASKSGNTATAIGVFNQYYSNSLVQTKNHLISLSCSSNGTLS